MNDILTKTTVLVWPHGVRPRHKLDAYETSLRLWQTTSKNFRWSRVLTF